MIHHGDQTQGAVLQDCKIAIITDDTYSIAAIIKTQNKKYLGIHSRSDIKTVTIGRHN